jgi:predicted PP-loop superfamily ATPase
VLYQDVEISETKKVDGLRGRLNKVVLAYSGGLDTSVVVPWLRYIYYLVLFLFKLSQ